MTKSISQLNNITARNGSERVYVSRLSDTVTITDTSISALAADNSLNDANGNFNTIGLLEGHRVKITGFTNTANNIESAVVTEITANKITFGGTDGDVIVDEVAGNSITISKWESYNHQYDPFEKIVSKTTVDPVSINSGDTWSQTYSVTGATLGDVVNVSFDQDLTGGNVTDADGQINLYASVISADTVRVTFDNRTPNVIDLPSGELKILVITSH